MRIAFYAPMKPPDHAVPSGDRRMAQLFVEALALAGHDVELASRFRSYEGAGDGTRQKALEKEGRALAGTLAETMRHRARENRPDAWFTYHLYHKAPDWIGPAVCDALSIPYVVAEASYAPKQADGPWAIGHAAVAEALGVADHVLCINPDDRGCVAPLLRRGATLTDMPPFLDRSPLATARGRRDVHRKALSGRLGLDSAWPWLLAVAMTRPGDKLDSYRLLARALRKLESSNWHLIVVGDGEAREDVEAAFSALQPGRVRFVGTVPEDDLPPLYASADIYVWPAVREAFGMAILEAQATGLPVVAGATPGVADIVVDGQTGILTAPGDAEAFCTEVDGLLRDRSRRAEMAHAAAARCADRHDLASAARRLNNVMRQVLGRAA